VDEGKIRANLIHPFGESKRRGEESLTGFNKGKYGVFMSDKWAKTEVFAWVLEVRKSRKLIV
jgi:hypothetical protein